MTNLKKLEKKLQQKAFPKSSHTFLCSMCSTELGVGDFYAGTNWLCKNCFQRNKTFYDEKKWKKIWTKKELKKYEMEWE